MGKKVGPLTPARIPNEIEDGARFAQQERAATAAAATRVKLEEAPVKHEKTTPVKVSVHPLEQRLLLEKKRFLQAVRTVFPDLKRRSARKT